MDEWMEEAQQEMWNDIIRGEQSRAATESEAHAEWHRNTGIPMGTPGCPQDACHAEPEPELECIDDGRSPCSGPVEYRMSLSPSGRSFPRCDRHWSERLDEQDRINERYPMLQPSDFDPGYAGESWDED